MCNKNIVRKRTVHVLAVVRSEEEMRNGNFGLERLREWTHQDRESVCDVCRKERERKSEKLRRERASDV